MLIIMDYDETYTEDPDLWDGFLQRALEKRHVVICCTYRYPDQINNMDVESAMGKHGIPIVYAANFPRKWDAVEHAGYQPNNAIWIDDSPYNITTSYEIAFVT